MAARLKEAANIGFKQAVVPGRLRREEPWPKSLDVKEARSLRQALELVLMGE
jgi:predicted ATP-dependent serine protease